MIGIPAGTRVLLAIRPVDFRKGCAHSGCVGAGGVGRGPVFGGGDRLPGQTQRSDKNIGMGHQRPRADLEAIAGRQFPLAADRGRDDAAIPRRVCSPVRSCMLMPLLVRLTDSEVDTVYGVIA